MKSKAGFLVFCFMLLKVSLGTAQYLPPILQKLIEAPSGTMVHATGPVSFFTMKDLPMHFNTSGQKLVKSQDGHIFLQPDGTGRVYRLDLIDHGLPKWTRIDSTFFTGYNFGSLFFSLDSSLYSFGGTGFWLNNGHVRSYDFNHNEWNGMLMSESHFWNNAHHSEFYFLDTANKELYVNQMNLTHDELVASRVSNPLDQELIKVNLENGKWSILGTLLEKPGTILCHTPWGMLMDKFTIIDIRHNRILKLSIKKTEELRKKKSNSTINNPSFLCFYKDSTLYIGDDKNWIDSMRIHSTDFLSSNQRFYRPPIWISIRENILWISGIACVIILFFIYFRSSISFVVTKALKPVDKPTPADRTPAVDTDLFKSSELQIAFDEREKSLIKLLVEHTNVNRLTSIQEINRTIGVLHKSPDIQKKMRSDLLININQKYASISGSKSPLIIKKRSEFDKRTFEYLINPHHLELLKKNMT